MTLTLVITFYDGDCHLIEPFLRHLGSSNFSDIDEIILISTGTTNVLSEITKANLNIPGHTKLHIIESSVRRSQATARNFGISTSTCEVVAFNDGDDFPHPSKFSIIKTIFKSLPDLDWLCHDTVEDMTELIRKNYAGLTPPLCVAPPGVSRFGEVPIFENGKVASGASSLSVRRHVLESIRYSEKAMDYRHEDTEFIWKIFSSGFVGAYLDWPLCTYRPSGTERLVTDMIRYSKYIDGDPESLKKYFISRGVSYDF